MFPTFPRHEGHCKCFIIPNLFDLPDDDPSDSEQQLIFQHLRDNNINIVRGDLIRLGDYKYRNAGLFIYDGVRFMDLDHEHDGYGALPLSFHVIENGVPINYWREDDEGCGISHNEMVWFNMSLVEDQWKANIGWKQTENGIPACCTYFEYNNITYLIIYDTDDHELKEETVDKLYKLLSQPDPISFSTSTTSKYDENDYTLFIF
jgi:hypothetical protein